MLNTLTSLFLIGLSIAVCVASLRLGVGRFQNPGPGLVPFLSSLLLGILSLSVLVKDLVGPKDRRPKGSPVAWAGLKKPLVLVIGLSGYALLLDDVGYLITAFLLMFLMFFVLDPGKWRIHIVVGSIVAVSSFLIFCKWLQVQLPTGIIPAVF